MPALFMAWRGAPDDQRLIWAMFEGRGNSPQFSPPDVLGDRGSGSSPALAAFGDTLFMAWRGISDDQRLFWATLKLRGKNRPEWSAQKTQEPNDRGSFLSPALAVFRNKLYMAWRGVEGDHRLFWAMFEGPQWGPQNPLNDRGSAAGPALAVFQDRLFMAWRGVPDDQRLFWATFDGTEWSEQQTQEPNDRGSADGLALAVFQGKLYMFWRGIEDDQRLFFATFEGPQWSAQRALDPPLRSDRRPAVAVFRNELYIAHIGTFTEHGGVDKPPDVLDTQLRYVTFDGERPKLPVQFMFATSADSPALAVFPELFPELTRSLKGLLIIHGFNPAEGVAQVGRGSVRSLMGL